VGVIVTTKFKRSLIIGIVLIVPGTTLAELGLFRILFGYDETALVQFGFFLTLVGYFLDSKIK